MGVVDAERSGDRRKILEAVRAKLAVELDAADAPFVAPIAARLQSVMVELEELGAGKPAGVVDELVKRRAGRRAGA